MEAMELPQCLSALSPRSMEDIAAAALAAQANVVSLRVAYERKLEAAGASGSGPLDDIRTPSPGPVTCGRDMLVDREVVKSYSADEALLRLRQIWGEFCALCWLFPFVDPQAPMDFRALSPAQSIRCCNDVSEKLNEVQRHLWRIRLEMKIRHDREARRDPSFQREYENALMHPVVIFGQDIRVCPDETLFHAACEYAGMLAALRWTSDDRWTWEGPGIMDVVLTS